MRTIQTNGGVLTVLPKDEPQHYCDLPGYLKCLWYRVKEKDTFTCACGKLWFYGGEDDGEWSQEPSPFWKEYRGLSTPRRRMIAKMVAK